MDRTPIVCYDFVRKPDILWNISVNFTHSNLQNTYSRKGLTLYAYSMKLYVTEMPKNMGQQTTNIQLFIAQIQSFAEGVSKTTKHKVLDLKQLKQSYSVVIQNNLLDIFLESPTCTLLIRYSVLPVRKL